MEHFWAKVNKTSDCWEWQGTIGSTGYGWTWLDGKRTSAHRAAWTITHGNIPTGNGYHGFCVLHRCDNRKCVNPEHLFVGTHKDNMVDMVRKGRCRSDPSKATAAHKAKTLCVHGHSLADALHHNGGARKCRTCNRLRCARYGANKKALDEKEWPV